MLISIITPCLNRAEFIEEAIQSVLEQDYKHVEHIIVDGGSTDGTLEILAKYPHLRVVSEPDQGVYDAYNKGNLLANGDWVGFLNSDDFYEKEIFGEIVRHFNNRPQIDALTSGATIFTEDPSGNRKTVAIYPAITSQDLWYRLTQGGSIFNAWFFRRGVLERIGNFDTKYPFAADRDFLIRCAFVKTPFFTIDKNFYFYRQHTSSLTYKGEFDYEADFITDCLGLAQDYLNQTLPENLQRVFQEWHSFIVTGQVVTALRKKKFHRTIDYIYMGWSQDIRWPFLMIKRIIKGFDNRRNLK